MTVTLTKPVQPSRGFALRDVLALVESRAPMSAVLPVTRNDLDGLAALLAHRDAEIVRRCGEWSTAQPPAPWSHLFDADRGMIAS